MISTSILKKRKATECRFSFYRRPRYSMDQEGIMISRKPHPKEFEIGLPRTDTNYIRYGIIYQYL